MIVASSFGPARPGAIGWNGVGGCVIASQDPQENLPRTVWDSGAACSSVSVTVSPGLASLLPPHWQFAGDGRTIRSHGGGPRAGFACVNGRAIVGFVSGSGSLELVECISNRSIREAAFPFRDGLRGRCAQPRCTRPELRDYCLQSRDLSCTNLMATILDSSVNVFSSKGIQCWISPKLFAVLGATQHWIWPPRFPAAPMPNAATPPKDFQKSTASLSS
jgi:hypothetical protein